MLSPACRYTAAEALQALNKVYVMMMEAVGGTDPRPMVVRLWGLMSTAGTGCLCVQPLTGAA